MTKTLVRRSGLLLLLYVTLVLVLTFLLVWLIHWIWHLPFGMILIVPVGILAAIVWMVWWAALPRAVPEPYGVVVSLSEQPELAQLVSETAEQIGVPMPEEIRLLPEMNAYASERGWWRPIRTLGLGFPLFTLLEREELRGIIAHELGHLSHGDSKYAWRLGGLSQSLLRTVRVTDQMHRLEDSSSGVILLYRASISLISLPLMAIAKAFLRTTSELSHIQEHQADAEAKRLVGEKVMSSALLQVNVNSAIFDAFIVHHLRPLAESGWRVPIAEGFRHFQHSDLAQRQRLYTAGQLNPEQETLSHPSLRARLGRNEEKQLDIPLARQNLTPLTLHHDEELTAQFYAPRKGKKRLTAISWDELNTQHWPAEWRKNLTSKDGKVLLQEATLFSLPQICADLNTYLRKRLVQLTYEGVGGDERHYAMWMLTQAVGLALQAQDWKIDVKPGHPVKLTKEDWAIEPETMLWEMVKSQAARHKWQSQLEQYSVRDMPLLSVAS